MRRIWIGLLGMALGLGACTSGGTSLTERLGPLLQAAVFGEDELPPQAPITRAVLQQVPFATISLQVQDGPVGYAIAQEANGAYVVYQDNVRRSVTVLGGLITGTSGLGFNLKSVKNQVDDPIAVQTELAAWPERVVRNYHFSLRATNDFQITVSCSYQEISREFIEIVQLSYSVTRVAETCSNGERSFVNTFWVDPSNGFIWQSEQWIGPRQDPYTVRVIRPFEF